MASTAEQLFCVTELLEQILLHAELRDILLSQRVAKSWRATVQGSARLKQALFFEPVSGPRLVHQWSPFGIFAKRWCSIDTDQPVDFEPLLDPLLDKMLREMAALRREGPFIPCGGLDVSLGQQYHYPEASWKRMLLTQPPVAEMHLGVSESGELRGPCYELAVFSQPDGGRASGMVMEDLVQECWEIVHRRWRRMVTVITVCVLSSAQTR
ncbi:hypothetical protein LTR37_012401 [Vermiconidia calcicola]|uniref:Uncharacterized protein n=1 Tax=Vermiconidia calcicola TaxID=1690605 RepID=A0ACC3MZJ0_9PEZI|nr:hypothetical protein LTR37_012401 [Vermiconidia calcicola]